MLALSLLSYFRNGVLEFEAQVRLTAKYAKQLKTAEMSVINHPVTVLWNEKVRLKRGDIEIIKRKRLLRMTRLNLP